MNEHGKRPVAVAAGRRNHPPRDLLLNHDDGHGHRGPFEEHPLENRGRQAVGEVGDDLERAGRAHRAHFVAVEAQDVAAHKVDVGICRQGGLKQAAKRPVELDRDDGGPRRRQLDGQSSQTGADLQHHIGRVQVGGLNDSRKYAGMAEEVLASPP